MLFLYSIARICQLYADRVPTILLVALHVIPPALFAVAHGSLLYRAKGIAVFVALCLGTGGLAESVSLRTGFPFGRYFFTDLMGPKVFDLPVMLALAYVGIGYVSWILAVVILDCDRKPLLGLRIVGLPMLAAVIMLAWDVSMDPVWSDIDRAWVWQDGGPFFGVPMSNFAGWLLTAWLYYQGFALYCRVNTVPAVPQRSFWAPAIALYALCAAGNLLILGQPLVPSAVTDAAGKRWMTADILHGCVLVSLLVMMPFALTAWWRVRTPRISD
jgi:putative membrane protein